MGRYGRLASDCPWKSHIAVRIIEVCGLRIARTRQTCRAMPYRVEVLLRT